MKKKLNQHLQSSQEFLSAIFNVALINTNLTKIKFNTASNESIRIEFQPYNNLPVNSFQQGVFHGLLYQVIKIFKLTIISNIFIISYQITTQFNLSTKTIKWYNQLIFDFCGHLFTGSPCGHLRKINIAITQ